MDLRVAWRQPFDSRWRDIFRSHVPFYARLDVVERAQFEQQVNGFVRTKEIVGFGGLEVDDLVRVVVASAACRLTLELPGESYGRLRRISVWPNGVPTDGGTINGCARTHDVELCWESLVHGMATDDDGDNVGYHEFAHVLDLADGHADGRPRLMVTPSLSRSWDRIMQRTLADAHSSAETILPDEALEDACELFAYATELFFETPERLAGAHPTLYRLLAMYYRQDPLRVACRDSAVRAGASAKEGCELGQLGDAFEDERLVVERAAPIDQHQPMGLDR